MDERFVDQLEKKKKEPEPPKLKVKFSRLAEGVAAQLWICRPLAALSSKTDH
jgi:hypothetical protein